MKYQEPLLLFHQENGKLRNVSRDAGPAFAKSYPARGLAVGDFNNDGLPDVLIGSNGGAPVLLRNQSNTENHWLGLKLEGVTCNRDAIGAEIELVTAKRRQLAIVTTASSYLSSSDKRVHFGLGVEKVARTIKIRWPSGILQTLSNVSADQILQVDEPDKGDLPISPGKP